MKNAIAFFFVILTAGYSTTQSQTDHKELLAVCLQNPELNDISEMAGGHVFVMQHGVTFDFGDSVVIPEREVLFLEKDEIINRGVASYFIFWRFDVDEDSAMIEYYFHINEDEYVDLLLELLKINGVWEVSKSSSERRLL